MLTAEEYQRRADEPKTLAVQTQDLWERETYCALPLSGSYWPGTRQARKRNDLTDLGG
jgi:hypothetical protein